MTNFNYNNPPLRVCIDRMEHNTAAGRVFSSRLTAPLVFHDLSSLALQMDMVFDRQNSPQAFQRPRTIFRGDEWPDLAAAEPSGGMSEETVRAQRGELATLEVLVISRRNSTWQGMIDWLDGQERQEFFSHLDLMRRIISHYTV